MGELVLDNLLLTACLFMIFSNRKSVYSDQMYVAILFFPKQRKTSI